MGIWEEQSKDLAQRKQSWESKQNFNFIQALLDSENEEEVKSAYVRHFSFPVKTGKRHDLSVNNVLFEFKYSVKFNTLEVAAKVIAQTIYYIHRLFESGEENLISHFIIADYINPRKTHHKKLILMLTSLAILLSLGTVYFTMLHNQSPTKEKPLIIENKL
jgi:hypothetical protein